VVIGGGVVGVSTLYHLARKGWADSVLIERKELTSGSTWHAAGLLPLFNLSYSVGQIHKYSVALYQTLEQERLPGGEWKVSTDKGEVVCEHIVSATGNFARATGRMVGINVPVIPVEHQYIVTEAHPEIVKRKAQGLPEMGVLRESDSSWYMREEAGGLLLGPYEKGAPACYVDGPSADSEYELFPEDLDRLAPHIETAIARVPAFGEVGVKKVYNGAIAYTPDGSPIVGPAPGVRNFWLNEGHSFGVTAAGGAGWQLAEWIVEGEPTIDMLGVDPRRFGPYADKGYLVEKNEEAYAKVFTVHYPDEERAAARPLRQTPCYSRMKDLGAVFGSVYGWERPNWFAPQGYGLSEADLAKPDVLLNENHAAVAPGEKPREKWSFRRSNYFQFVGDECRNVHDNVGLMDMSAFAKCEVSGPGAEGWLNSILTNLVPKAIGRVTLTYLLTKRGGVRAEFTLTRIGPDRFYLISAGALETHDFDALERLLPADNSVRIEKVTTQRGVLVLAGPRSREVLATVADIDVSNKAFPWLTARRLSIKAAALMAMRVNFVGELGYELHHPIETQNAVFDALMAAGAPFGIKPFGIRAMDSLRLEKSYKLVGRELSIEYSALESGLERFVDFDKGPFLGRDALVAWAGKGFENQLVTLEVQGVTDADARGSEPVMKNGAMIGRTTSGGYGWRTGKSAALAMVRPEFSHIGGEVDLHILGETRRAIVVPDSLYDPKNTALRS
jgi:dimethylglycine dehydrogenase